MTLESNQPPVAGESVRDEIRTFVFARFPMAKSRQIGDADSLLDSGIVDSLGILDIVTHLEEKFAVEIGDDDLNPENFDSIDVLSAFVDRKRA